MPTAFSISRPPVRPARPGRGGRADHPGGAPTELITEALAGTMAALALAQVLGTLASLAQLGTLAALLVIHRGKIPLILLRGLPFLAFPLWAMASTIWSTSPDVSLRYGTQLALTVLMGLSLGTVIRMNRLPLIAYVAAATILLLSIASRHQGISEAGPVLIGLTGSKNQFGYLCLLVIMSGVAVASGVGRPGPWLRLSTLFLVPVALLFLAIGHAAAAQVQTVLGVVLFLGFVWATKVSQWTRLAVLASAALLSLGLVFAAPQVEALGEQFRAEVLKKDSTLTGRTYLWAKADELIEQRPLLGWGYRSTWLGQSSRTIGLLRWAKLTDGRGFNFHDGIREVRVDLGIVGAALLLLSLAYGLMKLGHTMYVRPTTDVGFYLVMLILIAVVRIRTEVIVGPFGMDMLLVYALLAYARQIPWHFPADDERQWRRVSAEQDANQRALGARSL